jgi:hypothetical protein
MLYCHRRQCNKRSKRRDFESKLEINQGKKAGTAKWNIKGKKKRRARD